jgi:hypothetical protein
MTKKIPCRVTKYLGWQASPTVDHVLASDKCTAPCTDGHMCLQKTVISCRRPECACCEALVRTMATDGAQGIGPIKCDVALLSPLDLGHSKTSPAFQRTGEPDNRSSARDKWTCHQQWLTPYYLNYADAKQLTALQLQRHEILNA